MSDERKGLSRVLLGRNGGRWRAAAHAVAVSVLAAALLAIGSAAVTGAREMHERNSWVDQHRADTEGKGGLIDILQQNTQDIAELRKIREDDSRRLARMDKRQERIALALFYLLDDDEQRAVLRDSGVFGQQDEGR